MAIRTTYNMMSRKMLSNINKISTRMSNIQNDLGTTVKIHKPSDDPVGAGQTLRLTTSLEKNAQYTRNVDYATSWADATDSAFSGLTTVMQRARELSVKASSTGTLGESDIKAIKDEIESLYDQIIDYGNANLDGRYIFSGTNTQTMPFSDDGTRDGTGIDYKGNGEKIQLTMSEGIDMDVNRFGEEPFTKCLKALGELNTKLGESPIDTEALSGCIGTISDALDSVLACSSENGALTNRYEMMADRLGVLEVNYTELLSDVYDTDFAKSIMELTKAETTQQAAMSVAAKIVQTSLIDFLR